MISDETPNNHNQQPTPPESTGNRPSCACSGSPWRWFLVVLVAIFVVIAINSFRKNSINLDSSTVKNNPELQAALKLAQEQNKPILLVFEATWCGFCQMMKKQTFPDPKVIQIIENFVMVKIDVDQQAEFSGQFGVGPIPAYVILQQNGEFVKKIVGFYPADNFITELNDGLQEIKPI